MVYHPDHDGVRGNNFEEKLTSVVDLTNHLQHGKKEVEVFGDLTKSTDMDRPRHYIDGLKKEAEKGSGR